MLHAIIIFVALSLVSGIALLWISFKNLDIKFLGFLGLGIVAIAAAIKYTAGKNPYGYTGLGDISVFIFFGIVGVCGSYFLHTQLFDWKILFPAISVGLFCTAVLNLNNMRDILSDTLAGKKTIPARLGYNPSKIYHTVLIVTGFISAIAYHILVVGFSKIMFFLLAGIIFGNTLKKVLKSDASDQIDPLLKQTALGTLLFVVLFGIGCVF